MFAKTPTSKLESIVDSVEYINSDYLPELLKELEIRNKEGRDDWSKAIENTSNELNMRN